jgi:hypothetical protein
MSTKMEDISVFIESLGGLHDAKVTELLWKPGAKRLELLVKDLYANFRGLPDYKGPIQARFVFSDVSTLNMEVCLSERGILLYDWIIKKNEMGNYTSELLFSPSGKIVINCNMIECIQLDHIELSS